MSRGHSPVLNVLQGAEATELSFHHNGKTAAQCLTLLHAGRGRQGDKDKRSHVGLFGHAVISYARCTKKKYI